jgi:uncharacterized protein (TIGR03067 family)
MISLFCYLIFDAFFVLRNHIMNPNFSKYFAILFVLILTVTLAKSQDINKSAGKLQDDMEILQGNWICIMEEFGGNPFAKDKVNQMNKRMNIEKNLMIIKRTIKGGKTGTWAGKIELDPTTKPKKFDYTGKDNSGVNETYKGIYELTENEFKICFAVRGERPKEFKTSIGKSWQDGLYVHYLKEIKDDMKPKTIATNQTTITTNQTNEKKKILLNKKEEVIHLGNGVNLEMILIPAGKFIMGSPKGEKGRFSDSETQHEVTISKPYYIGKYEITKEQYHCINQTFGKNEDIRSEMKSKEPMSGQITYTPRNTEDNSFIKKINERTGIKFRLPTEAEWEYACRAGTTTAFHFGDELTDKDIFFGNFGLLPVGSFKPNAFGLYDMHGGVSELCSDNFQKDLGTSPVIDPKGNKEVIDKVTGLIKNRGTGVSRGGWSPVRLNSSGRPDTYLRSASRRPPDGLVGLRLVIPYEFFSGEDEIKPSVNDDKFEMVLIPSGKFIMGSPKNEKFNDGGTREIQHEVTLTKSYYMGKYEVTVEQWVAVMGKDPSKFQGEKLPITDVSWNDCQEFIKKLNATTKGGYRLPTEAEWEYACRAGTTTAYSFGDTITPKDAKMEDISGPRKIGQNKPVAVGSYKPNAFGLYDMHGNVCEWVEDFFIEFSPNSVMDPRNIKAYRTDPFVTFRGGSWNDGIGKLRSAQRNQNSQNNHFSFVGFRLAKDK